jgi:hypothetical protein
MAGASSASDVALTVTAVGLSAFDEWLAFVPLALHLPAQPVRTRH